MPTAGAAIAADRDQQRRRAPPQRFVRQPPGSRCRAAQPRIRSGDTTGRTRRSRRPGRPTPHDRARAVDPRPAGRVRQDDRTSPGRGAGRLRETCRAHRPPRHEQVSSRLPSRLISRASAPEFGELLGKGSALVVTSPSSGRTQRQIHRIGAEHLLGVAIREDGFDAAAAGA